MSALITFKHCKLGALRRHTKCSYAKTKGGALVHMESTSECTNHFQTLQVRCTSSSHQVHLLFTFSLGITVCYALQNVSSKYMLIAWKCFP